MTRIAREQNDWLVPMYTTPDLLIRQRGIIFALLTPVLLIYVSLLGVVQLFVGLFQLAKRIVA